MLKKVQNSQVVSKKRASEHGEVFTAEREVNAMLDLVKNETERIESRFLEPACGTGNFLVPILERKLNIVKKRYAKSQIDYERNALIALASLYGIELLEDNVLQCRQRLFDVFSLYYTDKYKKKVRLDYLSSAKFILKQNILWGDALSLKTVDNQKDSLIFSFWSRPFNDSRIKREDYLFEELTPGERSDDLFDTNHRVNDLGKKYFIPNRLAVEYPLKHYLKINLRQI